MTDDTPSTACLEFHDEDGQPQQLELAGASARVFIGRSRSADVALTWDHEVSRLHAIVELIGPDWTIVDHGLSMNGTYVNGVRLTARHRLKSGDRITVGESQLTFGEQFRRPEVRTSTTVGRHQTDRKPTAAQRSVLVELCRPYKDGKFALPASNQEIADRLDLSIETIKMHLRALFEIFAVENLPPSQKRARLVEHALSSKEVRLADL